MQRLRDSSWVTIAWDWVMTFLGRAAEPVLWATMIYSCYQLIPYAPPPPVSLSNFVFICQFISLDIGGMGLNKIAQGQGLALWTYPRILAYTLIGITLVTVGYAGLEHVVIMPERVTMSIEVTLVVIRSIMTVLYAQAIHDMKHQVRSIQSTLDDLRRDLDTARAQVSSVQSEKEQLTSELDTARAQVSTGQRERHTLSVTLSSVQQELESTRAQVSTGQRELDTLNATLSTGQRELDTLHVQVSNQQKELDTLRSQVSTGRRELDTGQRELDTARARLSSVQCELDSVSVNTEKHARVIVMSTEREKKQRETALSDDSLLEEQVRTLLIQEPGLSGRAIAARLGCSPTTASKWKATIERETNPHLAIAQGGTA